MKHLLLYSSHAKPIKRNIVAPLQLFPCVLWLIAFAASLTYGGDLLRENGKIVFENTQVRIEFRDPAVERAADDCRFSGGGWITRWRTDGREFLCTKSVFSWHPAYGLPEEFPAIIPAQENAAGITTATERPWKTIEGQSALGLRIGVGYVWQYPDNSFRNRAARFLPWEVQLKQDDAGRAQLTFIQKAEKIYRLTKRITVTQDGDVTMTGELENLGSDGLAVPVLLHPFYPAQAEDRPWITASGSGARRELPVSPSDSFRRQTTDLPGINDWTTTGNQQPLLSFNVRPAVTSLAFWRKDDCFAVEPELRMQAAPGDVCRWTWRLSSRSDMERLSGGM